MIDRPILELLTFGSNPDVSDFGVFCACFACFLHMFSVGPLDLLDLVFPVAEIAADSIMASESKTKDARSQNRRKHSQAFSNPFKTL